MLHFVFDLYCTGTNIQYLLGECVERAAMAVAFSSSEDNVMTRQLAVHSQLSFTNTAEEFDVSSTATWICEQNFRRVCITLVRII